MTDLDLKVPDGWMIEPYIADCVIITTSPSPCYYATVDFARRAFRGGITTTGKPESTKKYTGRGWKQKIVDDAVAWLRELEAS